MVTITLNDKTKEAKAILEMLRAFSFVTIHDQSSFNSETLASLSEKKRGKLIKANNVDELMKKLTS
jgi:hypothetical protein